MIYTKCSMKNSILIHGLNGIPKIYIWIQNQLVKDGIDVVVPNFPPQDGVKYDSWSEILDSYKNLITDETAIVCHSIGNEFLIKYLYKNKLKIKVYIGLAGFSDTFQWEGKDELNRAVKEFLATEREKQYFISATEKRYAIYSDDDHVVPFDILKKYPQDINAEPILIPNIGHMGKRSGLEELPQVLNIIKNLGY